MLTATKPAELAAVRISQRCPYCSAPIVGTGPIVFSSIASFQTRPLPQSRRGAKNPHQAFLKTCAFSAAAMRFFAASGM